MNIRFIFLILGMMVTTGYAARDDEEMRDNSWQQHNELELRLRRVELDREERYHMAKNDHKLSRPARSIKCLFSSAIAKKDDSSDSDSSGSQPLLKKRKK